MKIVPVNVNNSYYPTTIIKPTFLSRQTNMSYHEDVCSDKSPNKKMDATWMEHTFQRIAIKWLAMENEFNSIQFNSDICTRQLINYHGGARNEHRKHDPQVGDFKKKSEFSI